MIWNPGDGTDLNEGGDGIDTVEVNGGNGAETFTVTPNGTRVRFDRVTPAPFSLDIGTTENLVVNMNGGDDTFTGSNGLADTDRDHRGRRSGQRYDHRRRRQRRPDRRRRQRRHQRRPRQRRGPHGRRRRYLRVEPWRRQRHRRRPGSGFDTMLFNGANVNEKIDISANGSRVRFTRDVANITMDLNGVEGINFNARGGADTITVNDLTGTDLTQLNFDLSGVPGSGIGDGSADTVIVNGTNAADLVAVMGSGSSYVVVGLPYFVSVEGSEGANDSLVVNTLGGDDTIVASTLPAGVVQLTVDGGAGNDHILGSDGNDVLIGGDGNDLIDGGRGNDVALMGAGDDIFVWNPGDGSDTVEGQAGVDRMIFNGSNVSENIDVSANGSRVRFTRDVANITMDLNGVEGINFNALGGADTITVNDLTGTDLTQVNLDLASPPGSGVGDGQADSVIVNGTNGADAIKVAGSASGITVSGLAASVHISGNEASNDQLSVNALAGDDTIDASGLQANAIALTLNGGDGTDILIGSQGADLVNGGRGNDVALMGAGDDTFVWNPGDGSDTVEGQAGFDTMLFNGANVNEKIDISANGSRVRFTRDVANITMDLNGVEGINFNARGGADTITVNDLTGTDRHPAQPRPGRRSGHGRG